jgi:hypothetical protein
LAIMLGRLRMSIDECEEAYMKFSEDIFKPRNAAVGAYNLLNAQGKFSTEALEANIKELIDKAELPQSEKFDDKRDDSCKTLVLFICKDLFNSLPDLFRSCARKMVPILYFVRTSIPKCQIQCGDSA